MINQELTQRVIGAVVVTALAAIFLPMLFEDPVDNSGQVINNLQIPEQQFPGEDNLVSPLPNTIEDVAGSGEAEFEAPVSSAANAGTEFDPESALSDQEMMAEPPADTAVDEEREFTPTIQAIPKPSKQQVKTTTPQPPSRPSASNKTRKTPTKPVTLSKTPVSQPITRGETSKPELKRWYIQAGSFSKKENAQALADNLKKQGMPVFMETIQLAGKGTMYRLRVGPELDKKRAQAMQQKLEQQKIGALLLSE